MLELAVLRRTAGLTQVELAANLGVGQKQVSKVEHQGDMLISTLAAYLGALGAEAEIVVTVGDQTMRFDLGAGRRRR